MNQFEAASYFYRLRRPAILAAPKNEWAIDPYEWDRFIRLTPIEEWLWGDIRQANAVFYPQWPVAGFFVDFANPVAKVALECDGAAFHKDKAKDAARDEKLRRLGWEVYRFTGRMCRTECDEETGEAGEARKFLDSICDLHGLKRGGGRRSTERDLMANIIDHVLERNQ